MFNDTYILKTNKTNNTKLNTLFLSPWVPTWPCLGQHINLFQTHTKKKTLFLRLSAKILYSSVQQPEEKRGLVSLTTLSSVQAPSPVSKQQGTLQNHGEVKPRALILSGVLKDQTSQGTADGPLQGRARGSGKGALKPHTHLFTPRGPCAWISTSPLSCPWQVLCPPQGS